MLADTELFWREREPTEAQLTYLKKLCKRNLVAYVIPKDRGEASDLIDILKHKEEEDVYT